MQVSTETFGILVVLAVVAAAAGPAVATPPPPPAAYYGSLTVNGEPAKAGVTVTAKINGEVRGTLTTSDPGQYGGAGAFEPKLQVNGTESDEGATVQFLVEGEPAGTVTWQSGDVREVPLSATGVATTTSEPAPSPGGAGGGAGETTPSPSTTPTEPQTTVPPVTPPAGGTRTGTAEPPGEPSVIVSRSGSGVSVNVTGVQSGRDVLIRTSNGGETGLDSISIIPRTGGSFDLNVSAFDNPSSGTPPLPGGAGVGYIRIEHSIPDTGIDGVTFSFRVSKQNLAARGLDPEDVALYRLHEGAWTSLSTRPIGETATSYTFEADSPGLSLFAIGQRTTTTATPPTTSQTEPPSESATSGSNLVVIGIAIFGLLLVAGGVLALRRR